MIISHELRPGANRPGPPQLWQEFDRAVQRLGLAMEGWIMHAVALQSRDLATVMREIADLLLGETPRRAARRNDRLGPVRDPVRDSRNRAVEVGDHR